MNRWFWRAYTLAFIAAMVAVLVVALMVASSITEGVQARKVEACFEESDWCKQWMDDWLPVARWEDA